MSILFDNPSVFDITQTIIGTPTNDAQGFILYVCSAFIGMFILFVSMYMFLKPVSMFLGGVRKNL